MANLVLAELSEEFVKKAMQWKNRQDLQETITKLLFRVSKLESLCEQSEKYSNICKVFASKKVKVQLPKRKLSGRIRSLNKLIEECKIDPDIMIQPKIIDDDAFTDMFNEIKDSLNKIWISFCSYDKRAESLIEAANDDSSNSKTFEELKDLTIDLKVCANSLPEKIDKIEKVEKIKDEIVAKCNNLESEGFDVDIRKFLVDSGSTTGFPLNKLIGNQKILDWLKEGKRSGAYTILRK